VEHAYPVSRKGWLVIVLKRHVEALHELTRLEFEELGIIQSRVCALLHAALQCEKEYVSCYAETEHFRHIHFHVFAKPHDLSDEFLGGRSFAFLKVSEQDAIPKEEIVSFCHLLADLW